MTDAGFTIDGHRNRNNTWTPPQDEMLKRLIARGISHTDVAARINKTFGTTYTRNSTIGRSSRKKFKSKIPVGGHKSKKRRGLKKQAKPERSERTMFKPMSGPKLIPAELAPPQVIEIEPRRVTLLELRTGECRWPISGYPVDEPLYFCGLNAEIDKPYCWHHCALAYRAPEPRRR